MLSPNVSLCVDVDNRSPFFNMTHLVMQEILLLFKCCIVNNMTIWPQVSYYRGYPRNMHISMYNVVMEIHMYE